MTDKQKIIHIIKILEGLKGRYRFFEELFKWDILWACFGVSWKEDKYFDKDDKEIIIEGVKRNEDI